MSWQKTASVLVLLGVAGAGAGARAVRADVLEATPGGFELKTTVAIAAPRTRVYDTLVNAVGRWWDPQHTYTGDAKNLSIEPRPGGCFCERLPDQGGVQHAMVVLVIPGKTLRLVGGLGPLQQSGIHGTLTWELADRDGSTEATLSYSVGGYRQGGLQALAPPVDSVIGAQLRRLKSFVEKGTPAP